MKYRVLLWGSHPDEENDDCHAGTDPLEKAEAEALFAALIKSGNLDGEAARIAATVGDWAWVEIDGPDLNRTAPNPNPRKRRKDNSDEWKREQAIEAGMCLGISAYNEMMGWD